MTDAEFLEWLKSPNAVRTVLINARARVGGLETVFAMSTKAGYRSWPTDTPANLAYLPIATVGVLYTEQMSLRLDGVASMAAGTIEISNENGIRDDWLGYAWTNRAIDAWIGDPRWPLSDFRMIFNGIIADISPKGANTLVLNLRDKMQRLNTPLSERKLGGETQNKDALIPITLGQVHNPTGLLIDESTRQVHDGPIEGLIEARDNAIPVGVTVYPSTGIVDLIEQAYGTVTFSINGDKSGGVFLYTVAALIERIVKNYGKESERLTSDDIDLVNFGAFETAHQQPVGIYSQDRLNVITACQMLAQSVGAQISMSRTGKLRLLKLALPPVGVPTDVRTQHMVDGLLTPTGREDVVAAVKLAYCRNWTVQKELVTRIPDEHKDLFAKEWLTTTAEDLDVKALHLLDGEPVQQETYLLRLVDAAPEAQRRLDLWKVPRHTYQFDGTPEMLTLELGQAIRVYHPRFGMSGGVLGQVISLAPDWINSRVKVGFIV